MNRRLAVTALAALTGLMLTPGVGHAPPPLIEVPEALKTPVGGYDMRVPFMRWRDWVESRKGVAAEELLSTTEQLPNERPFGLILKVKWIEYDFGHTASADLRSYCQAAERPYLPIKGTCHYRLRRVMVPLSAAPFRRENAVSAWMKAAFDAKAVAAQFRRDGLSPEADGWSAPMDRAFAMLPSPVPILKANAQADTIDSRDCPEMGRRIEALERARLDLPLDLDAVGEDTPLTVPPFHGGWMVFSLHVRSRGGSGVMLEGDGEALSKLATPILEAAAACKPYPTRG